MTINVKDQDIAKAFYTEKLGMEVRLDLPLDEQRRWLEVAPPGSQTGFVLYLDPASAGQHSRIVLRTTDIRALHAEWAARGVKFTEEPNQQEWGGIQAQFVDPDGAGFVLVQLLTEPW